MRRPRQVRLDDLAALQASLDALRRDTDALDRRRQAADDAHRAAWAQLPRTTPSTREVAA